MDLCRENQTIRMRDGSARREMVLNIESYENASTYGEIVDGDTVWVVRLIRGDVWSAIGRKTDLDAAIQGLKAEATPEQERRVAVLPWSECTREKVC